MDGDIQKRIKPQPELPVETADLIIGGGFRVVFFRQLDGTVEGTKFHVHCPALYESAVVEDISEGQDIILFLIPLAVYSLVQVPRIAFMSQCGEEGKIILRIFCV